MIIRKYLVNFTPSRIFNDNLLKICKQFSTDTLNHRVPLIDPFTGDPTDQFIYKYNNPMFSAYLQKRKLKRSQIWPRIHILQGVPQNQKAHIKYQKLHQVKRMLDESLMKKIVREDPTQINSTFIISLFSEDHFKQLIDQYLDKNLVCGKAPSQQSSNKMKEIQEKTMSLYRNFYFGQKITPLERQIEVNYLAAKQMKFRRKKQFPKNQYFRCTWRQQDQRLIEQHVNWPEADINLQDLSYRQYYEPLMIDMRLPYVTKFHSLIGGDSFLSKWYFNRKIKKQYVYSQQYLGWIRDKTFIRVMQYTKCLQFTNNMNIPPDFMIEMSIINIHFWLIIDRLKQINTKKSQNLAKIIDRVFYEYFDNVIGTLNVKKLSVTRRRLQQILAIYKNSLNMHFNAYHKTKQNNYLYIDALVWSVAFRGKVQRYSDEVYKFSDYLVKNYQHLKNFDEQDFLDARFQFDPFLIDPDYRQKITQINPPLPQQQFNQQFKSNKQNKKYYYKYFTDDLQYSIQLKQAKKQQQEFSFLKSLIQKIIYFLRKHFGSLQKYDHYNQMEEQKKQTELKDKKSPWKSQTDRLASVDQEMSTIKHIRRSISKRKESSNILSDFTQGKSQKITKNNDQKK